MSLSLAYLRYTPSDWYWIIGGSATEVWSSARAESVAVTDATYMAWLAAGNTPTMIDTSADLQAVLTAQYPAGWPPTLAQQAQAAMAAGLTITSTASPALSGVYACDVATQGRLSSMFNLIQRAGGAAFPAGLSALPWPDINGTVHIFTAVSDFLNLETATGDYVLALDLIVTLNSGTLPPASVTIA